jgi:hypothetical protein
MHEQGIRCQASKQARPMQRKACSCPSPPQNTQASEFYVTFALNSTRKGITYALERVA